MASRRAHHLQDLGAFALFSENSHKGFHLRLNAFSPQNLLLLVLMLCDSLSRCPFRGGRYHTGVWYCRKDSLARFPQCRAAVRDAVRLEPEDTLPRSLLDYRMNSEEQRAHWDLEYEEGLNSLTQSDPFFISAYGQFVDRSFPKAGVALDLACGLGRYPPVAGK
jgi:hypothetical protein